MSFMSYFMYNKFKHWRGHNATIKKIWLGFKQISHCDRDYIITKNKLCDNYVAQTNFIIT